MATKKKSTSSAKAGSGGIIFTENAIVITLNEADKRKAKSCLKKNGKITFSVQEHSTTKLPQILDNGKQID
jgi:hypothetical protein